MEIITSIIVPHIALLVLLCLQWMRANEAERREKIYRDTCEKQSDTIREATTVLEMQRDAIKLLERQIERQHTGPISLWPDVTCYHNNAAPKNEEGQG